MKVTLVLLLLAAASAAEARGLLHAGPISSPFPLFGKDTLTPEQADLMTGVFVLKSSKDQRRIDGSLMDGIVEEALAARLDPAQENLTAAQMNELLSLAIAESSAIRSYTLVVPAVDPKTGLFVAYRIIGNGTATSGPGAWQAGHDLADVKRIAGMAYPGADGALYWQGNDNIDSAEYWGYLPEGGKTMEILRSEGIEVWNEAGERTLDDQSVVQLRLHKVDDGNAATPTSEDVNAVLVGLRDDLPLVVIRDDDAEGRRRS